MNDPACSSKSLDHFEISSDASSNSSIIWDRETPHIPNSSNPALVQKYNKCDSPYNNARQRIEELNIINSTQTHVGDTHIGDTHINNHYHIGNAVLPRELEAKLQNQVEAENGYAEHNAESVPSVEVLKGNQVGGGGSSALAPPQNVCKRLKYFFMERSMVFWVTGLILAIMSITSLALFFCFFNFHPKESTLPAFGHGDNLGDGIQVIQRSEWLARDPLNTTKISHPLKMVRILHTSSSFCSDYQRCANRVLCLQGEHVGIDDLPDIAYNFLIGGDGNVYIGRGADVENDFRPDAIDIAYVGNYLAPYDQLTDKMVEAGIRLIERLLEKKKISDDYVVVAHNQTEKTFSPGENVYKKIVLWPHYNSGQYFNKILE